MTHRPVVVIGAGVIGASTALSLQKDGASVLLLDRDGPAAGASFGNAGGIVNGSCVPTAMPGIAFDVLRMIGRPLTPFTVRLSYLPRAVPWLLRFIAESRKARVYENGRALHALAKSATPAWRDLVAETPLRDLLRHVGWLKVYRSEAGFAKSRHARGLMDSFSVPYEVLGATEIRDLEPGLAPDFARAIYQLDGLHVSDPGKLVRGMVDVLISRGGRFERFDVRRLRMRESHVELHDGSRSIAADTVVVAAGAWSGRLSAQMGDRVPLDTERGYHVVLPAANNELLQRPVMDGDRSFVLAPMDAGFRITSQVEFAGIDAEPDFRRIRSLLPVARQMVPGLDTREQSVWMGCRPSLPDSLPVIGPSPTSARVVYCFGHQHLGLTLGPVSANLVADIVAGREAAVDLSKYRVDRF